CARALPGGPPESARSRGTVLRGLCLALRSHANRSDCGSETELASDRVAATRGRAAELPGLRAGVSSLLFPRAVPAPVLSCLGADLREASLPRSFTLAPHHARAAVRLAASSGLRAVAQRLCGRHVRGAAGTDRFEPHPPIAHVAGHGAVDTLRGRHLLVPVRREQERRRAANRLLQALYARLAGLALAGNGPQLLPGAGPAHDGTRNDPASAQPQRHRADLLQLGLAGARRVHRLLGRVAQAGLFAILAQRRILAGERARRTVSEHGHRPGFPALREGGVPDSSRRVLHRTARQGSRRGGAGARFRSAECAGFRHNPQALNGTTSWRCSPSPWIPSVTTSPLRR